jgi:hypothetical protein
MSLASLRVHRPPAIRLIEPDGRSSSAPPPGTSTNRPKLDVNRHSPPHEADLFASLSLSTTPVIRTNPIFGLPSLHQSPSTPVTPLRNGDDPDAMDWTPTNPSPKKGSFGRGYQDDALLKPQHFFPPEEPTGLEGLLAQTNLVETPGVPSLRSVAIKMDHRVKRHCWIYALLIIPAVVAVYLYLRTHSN